MKRRPPRLSDAHWLAFEVLRKKCPTRYPVEVRVVRRITVVRGNPVGVCLFNPRRRVFIIYIRAGEPFGETLDTIRHEWAHARAWRRAEHGPTWGRQFALCYTATTERRAS